MSFDFMLNKVKILDNHELFGTAEVFFLSLVCPNMEFAGDSLLKIQSLTFTGVRSGDTLDLAHGKLLYHADEAPDILNWNLLIFEDDSDIRDTGKKLNAFLESPEFKAMDTALRVILATQGPSVAFWELFKGTGRAIAAILEFNDDDQIGALDTSFSKTFNTLPNHSSTGVGCGSARVSYTLKSA